MTDNLDNTNTADATNQAAAAQNPNETATDLTLQDLVAIKNIIDVASNRGAFRPNEMVAVGTVYAKLEKFLNAIQAQKGPVPNA